MSEAAWTVSQLKQGLFSFVQWTLMDIPTVTLTVLKSSQFHRKTRASDFVTSTHFVGWQISAGKYLQVENENFRCFKKMMQSDSALKNHDEEEINMIFPVEQFCSGWQEHATMCQGNGSITQCTRENYFSRCHHNLISSAPHVLHDTSSDSKILLGRSEMVCEDFFQSHAASHRFFSF